MLRGKNIVLTGSNRGIGLAILKECAKNGANVFSCMRSRDSGTEELIKKIADENGVNIYPVYFDIADEAAIKEAAAEILGHGLPIGGIVNNAGMVGNKALFLMSSMRDIRDTFDVNFFGAMALTQRLCKSMIRNRGGSIVNISSAAAIDGSPAQLGYVASKAALIAATKRLSIELGGYGIRVNAVAPGITETDMLSDMDDAAREDQVSHSALKRPGAPEEIAKTVRYLLSDESGYITGQVIRADGGLHI